MEAIKNIDPKDFVYIDEAGIDDNETNEYGWAPKGERFYAFKNAERTTRFSMISALNQNKIQAPLIFEGFCNRSVFECYIAKTLIPTLKPGQIVVMDNASFHKGGKIVKMIESAGCKVLYLPSYSPDLNPIEHFWFAIKNYFRKYMPITNDPTEALIIAFSFFLS